MKVKSQVKYNLNKMNKKNKDRFHWMVKRIDLYYINKMDKKILDNIV
jgi:hypothetical protein